MVQTKQRSALKLRLKEFKLSSLLEVTKAINNNQSTSELFSIFEYIIRDQLGMGKVILFSYNGYDWECKLKYGSRGSVKRFNVEKDLLHIKDITMVESSTKDHLNSFDIVIPVYHKNQPLAYLLLGDLDEQERGISPIISHMPFIQTLANIIVVAIENKRLANEHIVQERMNKEMELASEMQNMLFPETLPDNEKLQVAAYYQPHQQVGGDYYDLIKISDEEFLFCLADVSGKGVSAALLMANFQANLHALSIYQKSLPKLVNELNKKVMLNAKGEKFITFFVAKYNTNTRMLKYINAAHNPPLIKTEKGISLLTEGCTGLGMFDEIPNIEQGEIQLDNNSVFLGYTDGVIEIENENKQDFGAERLKEMLDAVDTLDMNELAQTIMMAVNNHKNKEPYIDDVAILCIRFGKSVNQQVLINWD